MDPEAFIAQLKRRPGMYLGEKSLTSLYHFYNGYSFACFVNKNDDNFGIIIPEGFNDWIAGKTNHKESTSGWCHMILASVDSEATAFDRFFELLEEYNSNKKAHEDT